MKFNHYAYIYLGPDLDPSIHHQELQTDKLIFKTVGIAFDQKEKSIEVAKALVKDGAQMIELCGGFGPIWIAKISEALNYAVPVGGVAYGPEARKPLLDLLSD